MPIYEYRCKKGHTFEVKQRMADDSLDTCTACDAPVQRVFHPVAVHFKGSGFYTTDYGKGSKGGEESKAKDRDEGKSKDGSDSSKGDSDSSSKSSADSSSSSDSSGGSSKSDGAKKSDAKASSGSKS